MPVGNYYLHVHAAGARKHVAVPCLARLGAKRGSGSCEPRDQQLSARHVRRVLEIIISVLQH
jgi:hypothetical protein